LRISARLLASGFAVHYIWANGGKEPQAAVLFFHHPFEVIHRGVRAKVDKQGLRGTGWKKRQKSEADP
jgi:hypothetical protein